MSKDINILYISLSGNTKYFIGKLTKYFAEHEITVNAINVKENPEPTKLTAPFVTFLPAFLEGGNGVNNGDREILTGRLGQYLDYQDNFAYCYGIVGSGNRNFNKQFALTAHQYAERYDFPFIADFELRGSESDPERIAREIIYARAQFENQPVGE
jgi:protein involved in ribonucleotide reduction